MSGFKNKSELNGEAARLLHEKTYYPAVAHTAYYACVQLMSYYSAKHGIDPATYSKEASGGKGSQEILINQIILLLRPFKINGHFSREILALKRLRVKAYYSDLTINFYDCIMALDKTKEVQAILRKYL